MRKRVFKTAWAIVANCGSFSEALSVAWRVVNLQTNLCLGVVVFKYKKVSDGSIREAKGTLSGVPAVKGSEKAKNLGVITYFDITANGWRSFRAENLIIADLSGRKEAA